MYHYTNLLEKQSLCFLQDFARKKRSRAAGQPPDAARSALDCGSGSYRLGEVVILEPFLFRPGAGGNTKAAAPLPHSKPRAALP